MRAHAATVQILWALLSIFHRGFGQNSTTVTTIFSTTIWTKTLQYDAPLQLCNEIVWDPSFASMNSTVVDPTSELSSGSTSSEGRSASTISKGTDSITTTAGPTGSTVLPSWSTIPTPTSTPSSFVLQAFGDLSGNYFQLLPDGRVALVEIDPASAPKFRLTGGRLLSIEEPVQVIFLRRGSTQRRQADVSFEDIGELLHEELGSSDIRSTDILSRLFFDVVGLCLEYQGKVYRLYRIRSRQGGYILKMAVYPGTVPDGWLPVLAGPAALTQSPSSTKSLSTSRNSAPSSTTDSVSSSKSTENKTSSGTSGSSSQNADPSNSSSFSNPSSSVSSGPNSSNPVSSGSPSSDPPDPSSPASSPSPKTPAYNIITSFTLQSFCSDFLSYYGSVTTTTTTTSWTTTTYSRLEATSVSTIIVVNQRGPPVELETPAQLTPYNAAEISTGCSSAVTSPSATSSFTETSTSQVASTLLSSVAAVGSYAVDLPNFSDHLSKNPFDNALGYSLTSVNEEDGYDLFYLDTDSGATSGYLEVRQSLPDGLGTPAFAMWGTQYVNDNSAYSSTYLLVNTDSGEGQFPLPLRWTSQGGLAIDNSSLVRAGFDANDKRDTFWACTRTNEGQGHSSHYVYVYSSTGLPAQIGKDPSDCFTFPQFRAYTATTTTIQRRDLEWATATVTAISTPEL